MTKLPRALLLACLLGALGLVAGYVAPLHFDPESNLGPLTGFVVTGPLGFVAGLALGLLAAWRDWALPAIAAGTFATALLLSAVTVLASFPDDRWVADVVDGTIVGCLPPERLEAHVLKQWSDSIALNPQNRVAGDWRARVREALRGASGRVAEVELARNQGLYIRQKPWNRGELLVKPVETDRRNGSTPRRRCALRVWGTGAGIWPVGTPRVASPPLSPPPY